MATISIVPNFDELRYGLASLLVRTEGGAIEQLTFQGSEEALAARMVEAIADRTHRRAYVGFSAPLAKGDSGGLAALITVMDHLRWAALANGHFECAQHQLCA